MKMKPTWWQRYFIRAETAAMGRGITLPWVGQTQKKRDKVARAYYGDDGAPSGWRTYWRSKNVTKLNNRDLRRMGEG
jgi:hypothetical protein